jgi:hypothetical protein
MFTFTLAKPCVGVMRNLITWTQANHVRGAKKKNEYLINNWDPGTLWTDFGVRADIVVSSSRCKLLEVSELKSAAVHL